jgi:hypothetical protein
MFSRGALLVGALSALGCGGGVVVGGDGGADREAIPPEASSALDARSGECVTLACQIAGSLLSCTAGGVTELCLSDTTQCAGSGSPAGCTNLCHPGEIGVLCGSVGPSVGPSPAPPASCRLANSTPGGITFACCPPCDAGSASGASMSQTDATGGSSRVFVLATLGPGPMPGVNDSQACGLGSPLTLQLGNPTVPLPSVVTDGSLQTGQTVKSACTVNQQGGGYNIVLGAGLGSGQLGLSISAFGVAASGTTTGITASFTSDAGLTYSDLGCTLSYYYQGAPLPYGSGPSQGRIWAHVDCQRALLPMGDPSYSTMPVSPVSHTCVLSADFLFEGCN